MNTFTDWVVTRWVNNLTTAGNMWVDRNVTREQAGSALRSAENVYRMANAKERYMLLSAYMSRPLFNGVILRSFVRRMHIVPEYRHTCGYVVPLFVVAVFATNRDYALRYFHHNGVGLRIMPLDNPTRVNSHAVIDTIARYDAATQEHGILLVVRKYRGRKSAHMGGDMTKKVIMCRDTDDWSFVPVE